jgi:uncharacterized protein involved in copper resistance
MITKPFTKQLTKQGPSSWLIALLALVFLGQSLAVVAMPCQSMGVASMSHDLESMDHSMMDMHHAAGQMDSQDHTLDMQTTHDCCKSMGHCSSGSCATPTLNSSLALSVQPEALLNTDWYHPRIPSKPISSLYRPPILR